MFSNVFLDSSKRFYLFFQGALPRRRDLQLQTAPPGHGRERQAAITTVHLAEKPIKRLKIS